jgi:hypothetical protein
MDAEKPKPDAADAAALSHFLRTQTPCSRLNDWEMQTALKAAVDAGWDITAPKEPAPEHKAKHHAK